MRKGMMFTLAAVLLLSLAALPFLCSHCAIFPERTTAYYAEKAARDAAVGQGPEAELMRLLLGGAGAAPEAAAPIAFHWYGLLLAVSALLGIAAAMLAAPGNLRRVSGAAVALTVPLGLVGARLVYCAAGFGFYVLDIRNPAAMLRIWEGGLSLSGALLFASLAGMIAARVGRCPTGAVLDVLTPGLLIFAAGARLAAWSAGACFGPECSFSVPVLTVTAGGVPRLNTALLMALAALGTIPLSRTCGGPGRRFLLAAFLYAGALLLLESLRRDGHLLWGFVHAEQVFALGMALPALLALARPLRRAFLALGLTAGLAAGVIVLEFALDRSAVADGGLYLIYFLLVGIYLAWGCACAKRAAAL